MRNETDTTIFDREDAGGYRPPELPDGRDFGELRSQVLELLGPPRSADRKRTLNQIKTRLGLSPSFDLSPVIEDLELDGKIRRLSNGEFTAFFLAGDEPERFWLSGHGTVEAKFRDEAPKREEEPKNEAEVGETEPVEITPESLEKAAAEFTTLDEIAKAVGLESKNKLLARMKGLRDLEAAYDRGRHAFSAKRNPPKEEKPKRVKKPRAPRSSETAEKKTAARSAKSVEIDPYAVEELAAEGRTQKEVAEMLGLTIFVFKNHLNGPTESNKALRAAWDRGAAQAPKRKTGRRKPMSTKRKKEPTPEPVAAEAEAQEPDTPAATEEQAAAIETLVVDNEDTPDQKPKPENPAEICHYCMGDLPKDAAEWIAYFPDPNFDTEFVLCSNKCFTAIQEEAKTFENPVGFDRAKFRTLSEQPNQCHVIDLSNGGRLRVTFEGDVFRLTSKDFVLLQTIVELGEQVREAQERVEAMTGRWQRFKRAIGLAG